MRDEYKMLLLIIGLIGLCGGSFVACLTSARSRLPKPDATVVKAPRKYSEAEICVGRCFPLVVSRFQPGTGGEVCECRSERLKLESP